MAERGAAKVTVALSPEDEDMPLAAWIDPDTFNPGYLQRSVHLLPKRGDKPEWAHSQDYWWEKDELAEDRLRRPGLPLRTEPRRAIAHCRHRWMRWVRHRFS